MRSEEKWAGILSVIDTRTKVMGLIALVTNAALLATVPFLPSEQRIYGLLMFAGVLVVTLVGMFLVELAQTKAKVNRRGVEAQNHDGPNLAARVAFLSDILVQKHFLPDVIIGIPRGGLVVAALLSKHLGDDRIVPVLSLCPTPQFANPFNRINLKKEDFGVHPTETIKVLIVDDISLASHRKNEKRVGSSRKTCHTAGQ